MDFNLRFDWICCVPRVPMKSVCSFDWILLTIRHFVLRWPPSNLSYFSCSSKLITIIRWTTMCPLSVLYIWFDVFMLPAVISEESLLFFFLWLIFLSLFFPFFNRRGGSLFVWLSFFFGAADSSSGRWTTRRRCLKKKKSTKNQQNILPELSADQRAPHDAMAAPANGVRGSGGGGGGGGGRRRASRRLLFFRSDGTRGDAATRLGD